MKKYLFCLVLVFGVAAASYGQSLTQVLNTASNARSVEKVKIGRFMMSAGKLFGGVSNMPVARGVHSLEVYDLSDCDHNVKNKVTNLISQLKDGDGYETLIQVNGKDDNVRIMAKKNKDVFSDIVILCADKSDPAIIRLSGKIKEKDIEELVNKYSK